MRIGYKTTDEAHWSVALRLAYDCGARLVQMVPAFDAPIHTFDALVIDLDYLIEETRARIVSELMSRPPLAHVAVHSYSLTDEETDAMERNGVIVNRTLGHDLFIKLAATAGFGHFVSSQSPARRDAGFKPRRDPLPNRSPSSALG